MIQLPMPNDTDNLLGGGFYYYDVNSSAQCSWNDVGTNFLCFVVILPIIHLVLS